MIGSDSRSSALNAGVFRGFLQGEFAMRLTSRIRGLRVKGIVKDSTAKICLRNKARVLYVPRLSGANLGAVSALKRWLEIPGETKNIFRTFVCAAARRWVSALQREETRAMPEAKNKIQ